jgi:hypothetical protein
MLRFAQHDKAEGLPFFTHAQPERTHTPDQNKKYRRAIGSSVAGSQTSNSPSARTS